MSIARPRAQRGFTFLEVTVAMAILTLIALVVERTLTSAKINERYLTAIRRSTEHGQKTCYEVFRSVSTSRKLYQDDTVGQEYLGALDLSRLPMASGSRLPLIDEVGELGPDEVGTPMTGNILFFVEETDPAPCVADGSTGTLRYVDTYRFVCVYRSPTTTSLITGAPKAHDLVVWRSVAYPSRAQLAAIEDVDERRSVVADLVDRYGLDTAWEPGASLGAAFYALSPVGVLAGTALATPTIDEDVDQTSLGRLVPSSVQLAPTDPDSARREAVFTVEPPVVWEPEGFEVKIAGASGSRKVWIHLVVESHAGAGRAAVHASTMIASTRDL